MRISKFGNEIKACNVVILLGSQVKLVKRITLKIRNKGFQNSFTGRRYPAFHD